MLLPEFWNRGHATEIVSELLKVARGKPEIHQIRAMMDPKNAASRRVLIKTASFTKQPSTLPRTIPTRKPIRFSSDEGAFA